VVWGLAFGAHTWPLASWLALAPLVALLGLPRPGLSGFVHGLAAWLAAIPWIVPTLVTFGELPRWLAVVSLVILASYLAAFHAAFAALGARLWRRGGAAAALLGLPALWVALEWLRTHLFGGFPWNLAGTAWEDVPGALPLTAWIGVYGLSGVVVFANVGLARAVLGRRPRLGALAVLAPLVLLAMGGRWGAGAGAPPPGAPEAGSPVAIVQPDIPNLVHVTPDDWPLIRSNYARLLDLSRRACLDRPGSLLVWPESAAWPWDWYRDPALQVDLRALADLGCPVLFNALAPVGESFYNSALLLPPGGGEPARYDKRKLVPFGEYVPFAGAIAFLDTLARNAGALTASERVGLLPWGRQRLGMAICFEVTFPEEVAELVQGGATVLVTITNDAWYGDTSAPHQHFRAARFRAAESRRPLVRAAITGISALVRPDGSLAGRLGVGERGVLAGRVMGRTDVSPYSRAPWAVPLGCSLVALFAIVLAARRSPP
jgi:apolipoprotein N-acyltransferase